MNLRDFIKNMVKIDKVDESYGHYPFQMYVVTKDDTSVLSSLLLGCMPVKMIFQSKNEGFYK